MTDAHHPPGTTWTTVPRRRREQPEGAPELDDRASMYEDRLTELRTRTESAERQLTELQAQHRQALDELTEQQALFDLQWRRMQEATTRWRAASPSERALSSPDLGRLLEWLMSQIDALAAELVEERRRLSQMADWAGYNVNKVRDMRPVVEAVQQWNAAGRLAFSPEEKEAYDETGRVLRLAARVYETRQPKRAREGEGGAHGAAAT